MTGREFFDKVAAHDKLEWLGVSEPVSGDEALVCHTETGVKHAVTVSSILSHTWKELEAVLTGKREARIMVHLTRIVGYYSRVQNWNRSKLAELDDRHKGIYGIPEGQAPATTVAKAA